MALDAVPHVALALLLSMAMRRWLFRALVYAAMLVALTLVWNKLQPPGGTMERTFGSCMTIWKKAGATRASRSMSP